MNPYYGGINFEQWIDRVMTAKSHELESISAQFQSLIDRKNLAEEDSNTTRKIRKEKQTSPIKTIERDWNG